MRRAAASMPVALLLALAPPGPGHAAPRIEILSSQELGDGFGAALAGGDFDGDGFADLAVGAPFGSVDGRGKVFVWRGRLLADGVVDPLVLPGVDGRRGFGRALAAADLDGDGRDDLIVGDAAGDLAVYWGVPENLEFVDQAPTAVDVPIDGLARLVAVGDLDGDGAGDLVAVSERAVRCACGVADVGAVTVLLGARDRGAALTERVAVEALDDDQACECLEIDGDCNRRCGFGAGVLGGPPLVDAGGPGPLIIGAPGVGPAGRLYVYSPFDPGALPQTVDAPAGGGRVGRSMAWIPDADDAALPLLVASADPGGVQIRAFEGGELALDPRADGEGLLDGVDLPALVSGHIGPDPERDGIDLLVGDAATLDIGRLGLYYGPIGLPLGAPDRVAEGRDGYRLSSPIALVGQMNGQWADEVAVRATVIEFDGTTGSRVILFVDGIAEANAPADTDGDGVPDGEDLCPEVVDPDQSDRDGDGLGDACDPCPAGHDDDGDGVCSGDCGFFFEPAAYASVANSPFSPFAQGVFRWFHLEDFEDGALDAPGLSADAGQTTSAFGLPAPQGVDGDNGREAWVIADGRRPLTLRFDPYTEGLLPTHAGLVITDTCHGRVRLEATFADGGTASRRYVLREDGQLFVDRFIGVKHPAGVRQLTVSSDCEGPLQVDDVQHGRLAEDFGCNGPVDNCPDIGRGDPCDCGPDQAGVPGRCTPSLRVRALAAGAACGEQLAFATSAAHAALRGRFADRGHEVEDDLPALDAETALTVDLLVLIGDGPTGDEAWCAIDGFVGAGGAVLDVRDFDRTVYGIEPIADRLAEGDPLECPADAPFRMCEGVGDLTERHGAATLVEDDPRRFAGFLYDGAQRVAGFAIGGGPPAGRAVVLGDAQLVRGTRVCEQPAFAHEPAVARLIDNAIDHLAEGPGYDPENADPPLRACFGPPVFDPIADIRLAQGEAIGPLVIGLRDAATPADALTVSVEVDDEGVLHPDDVIFELDAAGDWTLALTARDDVGETTLRLRATDRDQRSGEATVRVIVECPDRDGDGACDADDLCPETAEPAQADRDGDGVGDACDVCPDDPDPEQRDRDRDGKGDACDNCPEDPNPEQRDRDRDGKGDACDVCPDDPDRDQRDRDDDGVGDACDVCPDERDPEQRDRDGDGVGDACDAPDGGPGEPDGGPGGPDAGDAGTVEPSVDSDGDGWPDGVDNCPYVANPDQDDRDGDYAGDACDLDDGHERSEQDIHGMQLQGGCRATPGGAPGWPLPLALPALWILTRRRSADRG